MTKIDVLRRFLLPCFPTAAATSSSPSSAVKKRLSASLRDEPCDKNDAVPTQKTEEEEENEDSAATEDAFAAFAAASAPPRPSKTMVSCTIFGQRRGHVWFCIQHDRLTIKPSLLIELPIPVYQLVAEMRSGLVRIALECSRSESGSRPLRSVQVWTMSCNGRKIGYAGKRKASEEVKVMLKKMESITVGAGVIRVENDGGEIMYMRANYECVIGSVDSESFHLINPDRSSGQELSVFLLRLN